MYVHVCNAESQNRSSKGSNFKEDARILHLWKFLLYICLGERERALCTQALHFFLNFSKILYIR